VLACFANKEEGLLADHPAAKEEVEMIHTALVILRQLVQTSFQVNGNGVVWKQLADSYGREGSPL
jgi:hypothetical protein